MSPWPASGCPLAVAVAAILLGSLGAGADAQCLFDAVTRPFGAALVGGSGGAQCQATRIVDHGKTCTYAKPGSVCDQVICGSTVVGQWSTVSPSCRTTSTSLCQTACVPAGQCRGTGECNPLTGTCSDPPAQNGKQCTQGFCLNGVCVSGQTAPATATPSGADACIAWRAVQGCAAQSIRVPSGDKSCLATIASSEAGYCQCLSGNKNFGCSHAQLTCRDVCGCTPGVTICPTASPCHNPGICPTTTRQCTSSPKPDGTMCVQQGVQTPNPPVPHTCQSGICTAVTGTIYSILSLRSDTTVFFKAVLFTGAAGYATLLQQAGTFNTLVVPRDQAFNALTAAERARLTNDDGVSGDQQVALNFVRAHLVQGALLYNSLPAATLSALAGVNAITKNIPATNGYVNIIDRVLPYASAVTSPTPAGGVTASILQILKSRSELSVFAAYFEQVLTNNPSHPTLRLDLLAGSGFYTVFAPTNTGMTDLQITALNTAQTALTNPSLAYYHVVSGSWSSSELTSNAPGVLPSFDSGKVVTTAISPITNRLVLDGRSSVVIPDLQGSRGYVHIVDHVMLHDNAVPPAVPTPTLGLNTLMQVMSMRQDISSFYSALQSSSVAAELFPNPNPNNNGRVAYTVFAPTNAVMAALSPGITNVLSNLRRTLRYHVVPGGIQWGFGNSAVYTNEVSDLAAQGAVTLVTRDVGRSISIVQSGVGILINSVAGVVAGGGDLYASDGILHIISAVLVPQDLMGVTPSPFFTPPAPPAPVNGNTVLNVIAMNPLLSSFRSLLYSTRNDALVTSGTTQIPNVRRYTVFAPTNAAMAAFNSMVAANPSAFSTDLIVKNHLGTTEGLTMAQVVQRGIIGVSSGRVVSVLPSPAGGYTVVDPYFGVSGSTAVSTPDIVASDGFVHIIGRALILTSAFATGAPGLPPTSPIDSVMNLLVNNIGGSFTQYVALVNSAGLAGLLRSASAQYTVFAPEDAAFARQNINVQSLIAQSASDNTLRNEVQRFVRAHVAMGVFNGLFYGNNLNTNFQQTMRSLDNTDLAYRAGYIGIAQTTLQGNSARVTAAETAAANGLVYRIDNVLIPQGLTRLRISNTNPNFATPLPGFAPWPTPVPVMFTFPPGTGGVPVPSFAPSPTFFQARYDLATLVQTDPELSDFSLLLMSNALLPMVRSNVVTLFAVSNSGLRSGGLGGPLPALANRAPHEVQAILRNHIVPYEALTSDQLAQRGQSGVITSEQQRLTFTRRSDTTASFQTYINNVYWIRRPDIRGTNGVLHVIDAVLLPSLSPPPTTPVYGCSGGQTVCTILSTRSELRDFYILLSVHGVLNELNGLGPYTVLAPTNAAILAATQTVAAQSVESLQQLLREHIVVGQALLSAQLASSGLQSRFGANFNPQLIMVQPDLIASNGVVHAVSSMLIPSGNAAPSPPGLPPSPGYSFFQPPPLPPVTFNSQCSSDSLCGVLSMHSELTVFSSYLKSIGSPVSLLQSLGSGTVNLGNAGTHYTVFAPSNEAFASLPSGVAAMLAGRPQLLDNIMRYHVVQHTGADAGGAVKGVAEVDLPQTVLVPMSGGTISAVRSEAQKRTQINSNSVIVIPDQGASNGVVHVLSAVLIPNNNYYFNNEFPSQNIMGTLEGIDRFSAFTALLAKAGISYMLRGSGGPFTVFPVDNTNIVSLVSGEGNLAGVISDTASLRRVLQKHIFNGYYNSSVMLAGGRNFATVGGDTVSVGAGGIPANEGLAQPWLDYVLRDRYATNGIIHSVVSVLTAQTGTPVPAANVTSPPAPGEMCSVELNCSNTALSVNPTVVYVDGAQVRVCVCMCLANYAGTTCNQCAEGYAGVHPSCLLVVTANPQPDTAVPENATAVPPSAAPLAASENKAPAAGAAGDESSGMGTGEILLIVGGVLSAVAIGSYVALSRRNKSQQEEKDVSLIHSDSQSTPSSGTGKGLHSPDSMGRGQQMQARADPLPRTTYKI